MLTLLLFGIWGGAAGIPPVFKPEWARNSNTILQVNVPQPIEK